MDHRSQRIDRYIHGRDYDYQVLTRDYSWAKQLQNFRQESSDTAIAVSMILSAFVTSMTTGMLIGF